MNAPRVLVGIPAVAWMYTDAVMAQRGLRMPPGSAYLYGQGGNTRFRKRNQLANAFIEEKDLTHLLFLDSDMTPPRHTIEQLLSHRLPIVGALMFQRAPPFRVCAGHYRNGRSERLSQCGGPNPVQRVDWLGTGCMLIERSALLKIATPWFDWREKSNGGGEDEFFCRKATEAGVSIHCDTSLCVGHLGVTSIGTEFVMAYQETATERERVAAVYRANEALAREVQSA